MKMKKEMLTVYIPTFNRRGKLIRTLQCLEKQTNQDFVIYIRDNASDYPVESVLDCVGKSFRDKIKIVRNKKNFGADINIISVFKFPETKWVWLLSDDDYPAQDAVQIIKKNIEKQGGQVGAFNYVTWDFVRTQTNKIQIFSKLRDYLGYYESLSSEDRYLLQLDLVYMSNKVLNLEIMRKYYSYGMKCKQTALGICIPIMKMLEREEGKYCIVRENIVRYSETGFDCWNRLDISWRTRKSAGLKFNLRKKERALLDEMIMMFPLEKIFQLKKGKWSEKEIKQLQDIYKTDFYRLTTMDKLKYYIKMRVNKI